MVRAVLYIRHSKTKGKYGYIIRYLRWDVYLHENSWPGLYGILSAMDMLLIFQYVMIIVFVMVCVMLTTDKLITREKKQLSILRSVGMSLIALKVSFTLRFVIISALGSVMGIILGAVFTDPVVAFLLRLYGISNFSSSPDILTVILPGLYVTLVFSVFAFLSSRKIRQAKITELTEE